MTIASGPIGNGPIGSSGGASYVMEVTNGTFTLSMRGAGKLITDVYPSGQFVVSGGPVGFREDYAYPILSGSFATTGHSADGSLGKGIVLEPIGAFVSTGHAVTMQKNLSPDAALGVFTYTGQPQNYRIAVSVVLETQAFNVTFNDAAVTAQFPFPVNTQAFATTGQAVAITAQRKLNTSDVPQFLLTGQDVKFRGWFTPFVTPAIWTDAA